MTLDISRRNFVKLGIFSGITVMVGQVSVAKAFEMHSGPTSTDWIKPDGKAGRRWDGVRKVTGQKNFARDYRSRDIPGWPEKQYHAFMLKATKADRTFEGVDLSSLGEDLQPARLILQEDLVRDGLNIPQDTDFGRGFYGFNILVPNGETPPILGHPVAILIYEEFDAFEAARRQLQFDDGVVLYGEETGPRPPPNYGAARFVRIGGETPTSQSEFSAFRDAAIKGSFRGNTPVWPSTDSHEATWTPPVVRKDRGDGYIDALKAAETKPDSQAAGMDAVAAIEDELAASRSSQGKFVLERRGFSQSVDPCAMEPDNANVWYDESRKALNILVATQSPAGIVDAAVSLSKNNPKFPVETINLLTGSTVGYGSKDYSVFPFYAMAASFYGNGHAVRMANDRYEQFQMGMKRHSFEMDVTISGDRDTGAFDIIRGAYSCNGGGRENLSVAVSHVASHGAQSIYYFPKSDLTALAMATRAVEAGSMRGFGALQAMMMTEMMVDEIADELQIDPIELRRRNCMREGYQNTQGGVVSGAPRIEEMLDRAAQHPIWQNRARAKAEFEAANPGKLYGVGFAQVQKKYGAGGDPSILSIEFDPTGKLSMRHCVQEIGTGGTTAQQVLVWQGLGKVPEEVEFGVTDFPQLPLRTSYADQEQQNTFARTDPYWVPGIVPDMSSSSGAYYIGFATRQACRFLLENTLWPAARAIWSSGSAGSPIEGLYVELADVRIGPEGMGGGGMTPIGFDILARKAHEMGLITGVAVHSYSLWEWAQGDFDIPTVGERTLPLDAISVRYGDGAPAETKNRMTSGGYEFIRRKSVRFPSKQRGNGGPSTYTPAATIVEVNVNTFTGDVEVMRHHTLIDPGTMIVPELVSGQIQGGTAMGIGHALMEELPLYEDGPGDGTWNFNRYTLPRAVDVAVWNQTIDYLVPLSDTSPPKGMAEVGMIPIVPSLGNAIAHATGKRFYEFPISATKIKEALL